MSDTSLNLQKSLPEKNNLIISLVVEAAEKLNIPVFIVGATARDIIFAHVFKVEIYRETSDIDFGVAVESWQKFEQIKAELISPEKFRIDRKISHRLWHGKGEFEMKIDFVPFGELESPPGQIAFPPDGDFVMKTIGFNEAYQNSIIVNLAENLHIRVVSPAGLTILKLGLRKERNRKRRCAYNTYYALSFRVFILQKHLKKLIYLSKNCSYNKNL